MKTNLHSVIGMCCSSIAEHVLSIYKVLAAPNSILSNLGTDIQLTYGYNHFLNSTLLQSQIALEFYDLYLFLLSPQLLITFRINYLKLFILYDYCLWGCYSYSIKH